MKIIKAKVYYHRVAGRTTYREDNFDGYPACWNLISPVKAICTNEFGTQEFLDESGTYQAWLLKLTDDDYNIAIEDPQCESITEVDAMLIVKDIDPDIDEPEETTNDAIVKRLTIKAFQGKAFTKEEEDALDPDKPAKGINRTKSFLNKHAITW